VPWPWLSGTAPPPLPPPDRARRGTLRPVPPPAVFVSRSPRGPPHGFWPCRAWTKRGAPRGAEFGPPPAAAFGRVRWGCCPPPPPPPNRQSQYPLLIPSSPPLTTRRSPKTRHSPPPTPPRSRPLQLHTLVWGAPEAVFVAPPVQPWVLFVVLARGWGCPPSLPSAGFANRVTHPNYRTPNPPLAIYGSGGGTLGLLPDRFCFRVVKKPFFGAPNHWRCCCLKTINRTNCSFVNVTARGPCVLALSSAPWSPGFGGPVPLPRSGACLFGRDCLWEAPPSVGLVQVVGVVSRPRRARPGPPC